MPIMLISLRHLHISEVTPRGKECLFFSLFKIVGKASSFVGPIVSSAIIEAMPSHNCSAPFYFLTALSAVSFGFILLFVDLNESRKEQDMFLEDERRARSALKRSLELKDPWQVSGSID
jgi:Vacuole effluxer Atg22 like